MQNAVEDIDTSMVAVIGLNIEEIEKQINKIKKSKNNICEIANDNCPGQVILSGTKDLIESISQKLKIIRCKIGN